MLAVAIETVATSNADNLAYHALADLCTLTKGLPVRIVGGQMVALLLTAYPTAAATIRRTADADAGITTELAAAGTMHHLLTDHGYTATAGNSYEKNGQTIDLLIAADRSVFGSEEIGGRAFDAAPGLRLTLLADPIIAEVAVTLTDGTLLTFEAQVPTPEHAVILKASAYSSRGAAKDLTDLHNLLQLVHAHTAESIGGWKLNQPGLSGTRGDTQKTLHQLADSAHRNRTFEAAQVRSEVVAALIRSNVGAPKTRVSAASVEI